MSDPLAAMNTIWPELARRVADLQGRCGAGARERIARWSADASALLFHIAPARDKPTLVAILGGTGTGKSTLVNRILEKTVSASSFRRTFTRGAVAALKSEDDLPAGWLGVRRKSFAAEELPARGEAGELALATATAPILDSIVLLDTTDIDGDQPEHHAEADRVFRWAQAILFSVTPEKYQMTELMPYYRMARRYGLPSLFVINKTEEAAAVEDFRALLEKREWPDARLFAVPRDDAAYEPPDGADLAALREALRAMKPAEGDARIEGVSRRAEDLIGRLRDRVLTPLREERVEAERLMPALRLLAPYDVGVDVTPVTRQLQRKLQEQSILYLIGPQRIFDRLAGTPAILAKLPRKTMDAIMGRGRQDDSPRPSDDFESRQAPDFATLLKDQFTFLQTQAEDIFVGNPRARLWMESDRERFEAARIDPEEARKIAEEEVADLRNWLTERARNSPRDTKLLEKLVKNTPLARKITQWSESAPYLLAIALAAHSTMWGGMDMVVFGGYSLAAWATERVSNEVAARTRETNRRMSERFTQLARRQVQFFIDWLESQAPRLDALAPIEKLADDASEAAGLA